MFSNRALKSRTKVQGQKIYITVYIIYIMLYLHDAVYFLSSRMLQER